MRIRLPAMCVATLMLTSPLMTRAQGGRAFKARLAPVPIDVTMQATVSGVGSIAATLNGTKLNVTGTFSGLRSPATTVQMHKSPVRGVRGPVVFDLTATSGTSGTITGSIDLTQAQIADLTNGRLYVQLQSEKAPAGNLWGWLMAETKR